jgi:hypothetical protein
MSNIIRIKLVRGNSPLIRRLCIKSLLYFLFGYPITKPLLHDYITFFIVNSLNFQFDYGRLAALDLLRNLIKRLPKSIVEINLDLFLFPLVTQMTGDESVNCRLYSADCINVIIKSISFQSIDMTMTYIIKWLRSGVNTLILAAIKLARILIKSIRKNYYNLNSRMIEQLVFVLAKIINTGLEKESDITWNEYLVIECLQLFKDLTVYVSQLNLKNNNEIDNSPKQEKSKLILEITTEFLLYPQKRVRKLVVEIISNALTRPLTKHMLLSTSDKTKLNRLGELVKQIYSRVFITNDDATTIKSIKLLVSLANEIYKQETDDRISYDNIAYKTHDLMPEGNIRKENIGLSELFKNMMQLTNRKIISTKTKKNNSLMCMLAVFEAFGRKLINPQLLIICKPSLETLKNCPRCFNSINNKKEVHCSICALLFTMRKIMSRIYLIFHN